MKKIKKISLLLLASLYALLMLILPACNKDEITEPAIYTPEQLKRLLLEDDRKTWQQITEYYLEDSCRTGKLLRFEDNAVNKLDSAFFAYFIPDTAVCDVSLGQEVEQRVKIVDSPIYQTTDSLLFIANGDTTIKTIGILTSQRLILNVAGENGRIIATEEYEAVR